MKKSRVNTGWGLAGLLSVSGALAANSEPVVVEATFVDAITITEVNALQFGLLQAALANTETLVISPASGLTDTFGRVVGGTQAAASLTGNGSAVAGPADGGINVTISYQ